MLGLIKGEYFKQHGQGYLTHLHIGLQSKKGKFLFCLFALVELSGLITGGYFEQHEKGNFKFHCFNFSANLTFRSNKALDLAKVLNLKNENIHVDLIIYNHIDYTYEDKIETEIFKKGLEEIARNLINNFNDENKSSSSIFIGPNIFLSHLLYNIRLWTVDSYGYHRPENSYDKSRIDIKKYNDTFIYYFCEFDQFLNQKIQSSIFVYMNKPWKDIKNFLMY